MQGWNKSIHFGTVPPYLYLHTKKNQWQVMIFYLVHMIYQEQKIDSWRIRTAASEEN